MMIKKTPNVQQCREVFGDNFIAKITPEHDGPGVAIRNYAERPNPPTLSLEDFEFVLAQMKEMR